MKQQQQQPEQPSQKQKRIMKTQQFGMKKPKPKKSSSQRLLRFQSIIFTLAATAIATHKHTSTQTQLCNNSNIVSSSSSSLFIHAFAIPRIHTTSSTTAARMTSFITNRSNNNHCKIYNKPGPNLFVCHYSNRYNSDGEEEQQQQPGNYNHTDFDSLSSSSSIFQDEECFDLCDLEEEKKEQPTSIESNEYSTKNNNNDPPPLPNNTDPVASETKSSIAL